MKIKVNETEVTLSDFVNLPSQAKIDSTLAQFEGRAEEPFYVCDLGDIIRKHRLWSSKLSRVEPFYAMKCNPTPLIVSILSTLGVGFDCASKEEIAQALASGVPASRIIFANPAKQASHLHHARANEIRLMTFDCIEELNKIKANHEEAQLVLRVFTGNDKALCPLGKKFGAFPHEILAIFEQASALGLTIVGVSFHVGSGCFDASAYNVAISYARQVFNLGLSLGFPMKLLDIGGGFPGNLDTNEEITFFESVCDVINSSLDQHFPADENTRIIAEPGRYYVSSAFDLVCTVTSVREYFDEKTCQTSYNYFLNDGVYGSFNCTHFDHYIGKHYLFDESDNGEEAIFPSVFWGPTCDNMDKVLENFFIKKLEVGSCVAFRAMGAYTMAAGSCFNGFPRPYINYYASKRDWTMVTDIIEANALNESKLRLSPSDEETSQVADDSALFSSEIADVI